MKHPPRTPHPHGDGNETPPINHAAEVRARATAPVLYSPPAGFPADPVELAAYFEAGQFTAEQAAYLHAPTALAQYEAAQATANDPLAARILTAWRAWLAANPAPPTVNPSIA